MLGLLELTLRMAHFGNDYPLFVAVPDHPDYLVANKDFSRRYFGSGSFAPSPQLDFFRAEKQPGTLRIVFQGESSALGFPYTHGAAPSRMLEQRLQTALPSRNIEVINTALTAINSYTLLDQADEIIDQHPDAVMIYTGHNEFYGVYGAGSTHSLPPTALAAYLKLRHLRTVQLLGRIVAGTTAAARGSRQDAPRTVMEMMAGDQQIPLGSETYKKGVQQFRANLDALLSRYRGRGIRVFIGTVASNLRDQPPFAGEQAKSLYQQAKAYDAGGDSTRALTVYREARDRDELRFRAPEEFNDIIREEAHRNGAELVDTERALEVASPRGIVGRTLMLEHLHPNIDGYFIIADAFFEALGNGKLAEGLAETSRDSARQAVPVTEVDSIAGLLHADRLTSGWPFQPRGVSRIPRVDTMHPGTVPEQLAKALVLGTVTWPEATDRLRVEYEKKEEVEKAIRTATVMAQEYRYSAQPYVDAARIAAGARRYGDALRFALAANSREESPGSLELAGLLLLRTGDNSRALPYLRRAAQLSPGDRRAATSFQAAEALPRLEERRRAAPRDTIALFNLAVAYAVTQQYDKATSTAKALLDAAPNHNRARQLLLRMPRDSA